MDFFSMPAGGRPGPLAEHRSVLPVGECHAIYRQRAGGACKNFLRCRRQVAKLVRAAASQEVDDRGRSSVLLDVRKDSAGVLQEDVRGLSDAQAKIGYQIMTFVTGLQKVQEGLAEVCAYMLGQFLAGSTLYSSS